ncbi:MAG: DUF2079 domain-containing protein [Scytonematopsis contorta HA4267-MV1]|jgi:uncharacterized membrane protein|nr:DUF2079 domain-containing protein [Scytonematopsis contorta HA4267-MV1]
MQKLIKLNTVGWITVVSAVILLLASILKHELFQSTAFDLGIFDQAIYLISQGKPPISTYMGFHILGDHAALIHYLLAALYKIYPTVYWLFVVQSVSLALGTIPTWYLALQAGLKESQALAMAIVYLLYPVVFNVNLFDFHPEVIALPLFLAAVLFARQGKIVWFGISIIFILACKAVLSLTVVAMGFWLLVFDKRRVCGLIAILAGIAWFLISTQIIIPTFSGKEAAAVGRYSYLGNSVFEIATNLILKPGIIFGTIFSLDNLGYIILLIIPIIWGLSYASIKPLLGAVPCIALNLLTDYQTQKDLVHQYSLPALPFLIIAVISTLAAGKGWLQTKRAIIIWSIVSFLCLAKYTYFGGRYLKTIDTWGATREAISLVKTKGSVYTTAEISPHLSHRELINFTSNNVPSNLAQFNYILLNTRHPGWGSSQEFAIGLVNKLKSEQKFNLQYQRDDVYLFVKKN